MTIRSICRRSVSVAALAVLLVLGACSGDDASEDDTSDPDRVESADSGSDAAQGGREDTGRPFDVGRDDLATALAAATGADDHEVDGDTIRLVYDDGSVDSSTASINCSVAEDMKADEDRVELVYPDGVLECGGSTAADGSGAGGDGPSVGIGPDDGHGPDDAVGTADFTDVRAVTAEWSLTAVAVRQGDEFATRVTCPAGGSGYRVWGTDIYSDDSSVCTAAVHIGLITFDEGGEVLIEHTDGLGFYRASERNGVSTREWDSWSGSFVFIGARGVPIEGDES